MKACVLDTSSLDGRYSMANVSEHIFTQLVNAGYEASLLTLNHPRTSSPFVRSVCRYILFPFQCFFIQSPSIHIVDHSFGHLLPFLFFCKTRVYYVHDLIPLHPSPCNPLPPHTKLLFFLIVYIGLLSSSKVLCVSRATRDSLLAYYPYVNPSKFIVSYNTPKPTAPVLYTSPNNCCYDILLIGSNWYKNHLFTVQSLLKLSLRLRIACLNISPRDLQALLASHHIVSSFQDIASPTTLYSSTKLIINYSIVEGFGLTPFEAALCNCCSILSDIPIHRELHALSINNLIPLHNKERLNAAILHYLASEHARSSAIGLILADYESLSRRYVLPH